MRIDFHASGAIYGSPLEYATQTLEILLVALVRLDLLYLERHPDTPPLYRSGVRYKPDPKGTERWGDVGDVLSRDGADCEDLSCWRVAELLRRGEKAGPYIAWRVMPDGRKKYHILVKRGVHIECPSTVLGMRERENARGF